MIGNRQNVRWIGLGVPSLWVVLLLVFLPPNQNSAFGVPQEDGAIDAETLELVQQGWEKAFKNSRDVKQLQAKVRRTNVKFPNVVGNEVHSFAIKGDKRLYASSHNGHVGDLTAKTSCLRLFDGTNDALANSADLFQVSASNQERWALESLNQNGQIHPLVERLYAFVWAAGVTVTDSSFSLDYFDLSAPHVEIKEVRRDPTSVKGLISLRLLIDRQKYKGNNPIGIREVQMKLDPKFDYLPVESTTFGLIGDTFTDYYQYQPFNRSFYLKSRNGNFEVSKDGTVVAGGTHQMEIQLLSTEASPDHVFRLATYGLTEPKPRTAIDSGFRAWHLILVGLVIVAVGLAVRRYTT